jgi:nitrous oxidase accessory protein NosD
MRYILTTLFALVAGLAFVGQALAASTLYVDAAAVCAGNSPCYATVQGGIDAASPGDTVFVYAGTYTEALSLNKSITLQGQDKATTIIDASGSDGEPLHVFQTTGVVVSGFTLNGTETAQSLEVEEVDHSTFTDLITPGDGPDASGIAVRQSSSNTFSFLRISGEAGVDFFGSSSNLLTDSLIAGGDFGVFFHGTSPNVGNVLDRLTITNIEVWGVVIGASSSGTTVQNSEVSTRGDGLLISGPGGNTIRGNSIHDNDRGVTIGTIAGAVVTSNQFDHNRFVSNLVQVSITGGSHNIWDAGYPGGGNFWSDYTGIDQKSGVKQNRPGSDGLGDTPYLIDSANIDHYPLVPRVHHGPPTNKEQCKNGGWRQFDTPRTFKNQGDCVSFVQTGRGGGTPTS